ncbi:RapH N-terminal domain-containing protein [Bacillus pumilus]|uniref:Tetratricopeptide repeat protein n=1 Tax=Bacillus pumilus TaxID=1408 RepID=A0AAD0HL22_BACPU|nr:RapH N-terminal domain-containing protein [Bacillus pumilus]AVM23327.1 tetratricopeptide repeat protein [Bacillus pumilus]TYS44691.1 tetratricopeptide repeat protein [Bacillus pumilus]
MRDLIPYDLVTTKLNHWYRAIKTENVDLAREIKQQVKSELDSMEENQDALLYFSLLEFRHSLLESHLNAKNPHDLDKTYLTLKKVERQENLTGMLEYYYYFFMGMYEFRRKELTTAISAYRKAEMMISEINDEIEQAEFYFKVSYVYYYMKQTYFSLNYANRALNIYERYDDYLVQALRCRFVIGGNLIDESKFRQALHIFIEILDIAEKNKLSHIKGMAHINAAICYEELKQYSDVCEHLDLALNYLESHNNSFVTKALFNQTHVYLKRGMFLEAKYYYIKGLKYVDEFNDEEYKLKFMILTGLYYENDHSLILEAFDSLLEKNMYADVENLALEVAEYFSSNENFKLANDYFRMSIDVRRKIREEELIDEKNSGYIYNVD